jgi:hypothetical protein
MTSHAHGTLGKGDPINITFSGLNLLLLLLLLLLFVCVCSSVLVLQHWAFKTFAQNQSIWFSLERVEYA